MVIDRTPFQGGTFGSTLGGNTKARYNSVQEKSLKSNNNITNRKYINPLKPKSRKGNNNMKTKEEVIEMIRKDMTGCYTCSWSCDEQGYNGMFSSQYVDDLFQEENQLGYHNNECILDEEWELSQCQPVTNEDIDIYEWAQEFDDDTIERLRKEINEGGYYIVTFCNDTCGTLKFLVW